MNKKIKKIYMHIGVAKSGTSSLQMSLLKSREQLKKLDGGYLYPKISFFHHGRFLYYKFSNILPNPREFLSRYDGNVDKLKEKIATECKRFENEIIETECENLVISGEQIARLKKDKLENLKTYLHELAPNAEINIVVCTREHTSRFVSKSNEKIKVGGAYTLQGAIRNEKNFYRKKLSKFLEIFNRENIIVYQFEDIKKHTDGPIGLFFSVLNISTEKIKLVNFRSNESYSAVAIDIILHINNKLPLMENEKFAEGRKIYDTRYLGKLQGGKFLCTEEIIKKVHVECMKDKIWLKDNLGIDYLEKYSDKFDTGLTFDESYCKQFKYFFIKLRPVIKKLSYDYITEKLLSTTIDKRTIDRLVKLVSWMDTISLDFKSEDIEFFIKNNENRYKVNIISKLSLSLYMTTEYFKKHGVKKGIRKIYNFCIKKVIFKKSRIYIKRGTKC